MPPTNAHSNICTSLTRSLGNELRVVPLHVPPPPYMCSVYILCSGSFHMSPSHAIAWNHQPAVSIHLRSPVHTGVGINVSLSKFAAPLRRAMRAWAMHPHTRHSPPPASLTVAPIGVGVAPNVPDLPSCSIPIRISIPDSRARPPDRQRRLIPSGRIGRVRLRVYPLTTRPRVVVWFAVAPAV